MKFMGILLALLLALVPVALAQSGKTDFGEAKIMISQGEIVLEESVVTQERAQAEGFWNVDPVIASLDWIFGIVGALISTVEAIGAWFFSICPSMICVTIWDLIWESVDAICASFQDILVGFCASACGFIFGILGGLCGSILGICAAFIAFLISLCGTIVTEVIDLIAGGIEALASFIGICWTYLSGIDFINYIYEAVWIFCCEVIPCMNYVQTGYLCFAGLIYLIPCCGPWLVGAIPAYITLFRSWLLENCQNMIPVL
jgi:hypothetical protein